MFRRRPPAETESTAANPLMTSPMLANSAAQAAAPATTETAPAPAAAQAETPQESTVTDTSTAATLAPSGTTSAATASTAATPVASPSPANPLTAGFRSDLPRRVVDIPNAARRPGGTTETATAAAPAGSETRKLTVGRDISLSGEIAACDILVVEGTVEAKLPSGRVIEITETGLFKGSVEIEEADIAGRFEGDISVRGTLKVRASGRITGSIRYGTLEVESGGRLSGTIESLDGESAKS